MSITTETERHRVVAVFVPKNVPDSQIARQASRANREPSEGLCLAVTTPASTTGRWICVLAKDHAGECGMKSRGEGPPAARDGSTVEGDGVVSGDSSPEPKSRARTAGPLRGAEVVTVEGLVESLDELAEGAAIKMREKHDEADREHGIPRWGETYFAGYLHGVCASIAIATGEPSEQIAVRYEELTP